MVGLLIVTHGNIGASILDAATKMLGVCPLKTQFLGVSNESDPDLVYAQANQHIESLDDGEGVLVLTDMYGSTPSNIACRLADDGRTLVVGGINLPMLVRVLNYPRLGLQALADKALSGGRDGVLLCKPTLD